MESWFKILAAFICSLCRTVADRCLLLTIYDFIMLVFYQNAELASYR